ncbi:MAG: hypothetical protein J6Y55_08390 [Bacteroidales bacterium]|nr:hypothetical protein [Bacteroidales bacterium]
MFKNKVFRYLYNSLPQLYMMTYPNYTSERYYADNYEEVHAGDTVYRYYYVYTPDGLSMVAERIGNNY